MGLDGEVEPQPRVMSDAVVIKQCIALCQPQPTHDPVDLDTVPFAESDGSVERSSIRTSEADDTQLPGGRAWADHAALFGDGVGMCARVDLVHAVTGGNLVSEHHAVIPLVAAVEVKIGESHDSPGELPGNFEVVRFSSGGSAFGVNPAAGTAGDDVVDVMVGAVSPILLAYWGRFERHKCHIYIIS